MDKTKTDDTRTHTVTKKKNTKRGRVIASSAYEFIIIYEEQRKEREY